MSVTEKAHDEYLSEHGRMDFREGFETKPQTEFLGRPEADAGEQAFTANVRDHFEISQFLSQSPAHVIA